MLFAVYLIAVSWLKYILFKSIIIIIGIIALNTAPHISLLYFIITVSKIYSINIFSRAIISSDSIIIIA